MDYIDLFSGIGGFAYGAYLAGMKFGRHYFSENNPYCIELYKKRFPEAESLGKIENYKEWKFENELLCTAGFPCQPFSNVGNRKQRNDPNYLWPELFEFIQYHLPAIILIENVPGIDTDDPVSVLEEIYDSLESVDYETHPALEIPAGSFDAIHNRNRVWILAYSKKGRWWARGRISKAEMWQNEPAGLESESVRKKLSTGFYGRGYDGIPNRLDRLEGLGNAIVPQIAQMFFTAIKELIC